MELIQEYRGYKIYETEAPPDYPGYTIYIDRFYGDFGGQYCQSIDAAKYDIDGDYGYSLIESEES